MIVAMQEKATEEQIQNVIERMVEIGFNVHRTTGALQTILAGVGTPASSTTRILSCWRAFRKPCASRRRTNLQDAVFALKARLCAFRTAWK